MKNTENLTPEEVNAWQDLARAAQRLREAQRKARQRRKARAKKKGGRR